jgi:RNA polymerase sigma factor (sigma-70 family)
MVSCSSLDLSLDSPAAIVMVDLGPFEQYQAVRGLMAEVDSCSRVEIPEPFVRFFQAEYAAVVSLVYGLSGSRAAAEDIAQEAFLRAHRDWKLVEMMDSPEGWVRRVAINLAKSRWRRLRAETSALARLTPPTSLVPPDDQMSVFWEEVRRLPTRQAQAVTLHYLEDMSVDEIAAVLEIANGTVKALLSQGRERLRRQLIAKGLVDDEV